MHIYKINFDNAVACARASVALLNALRHQQHLPSRVCVCVQVSVCDWVCVNVCDWRCACVCVFSVVAMCIFVLTFSGQKAAVCLTFA